jgi:hypothetical protein
VNADLTSAPYVHRLVAEWHRCSTREAQASIEARVAGYLAREGNIGFAEAERERLRREYGHGVSPRVSILLMCLDAFIYYYKDTDPRAIDRAARAKLLSRAFGLDDLLGFSSAWSAHFAFGVFRPSELVESLLTAVATVKSTDVPSMCRLAMTLGDTATYFGEFEVARGWYSRAHNYAVDLGDHAFISALNFNRPATTAFAARLHRELG